MNRIENGTYTTNGLSTATNKFWDTLRPMGEGKYLKRILTYLDCTKNNEIDTDHSHIQKHNFCKKCYKKHKNFVYRLTQKFSNALHSTGGNF